MNKIISLVASLALVVAVIGFSKDGEATLDVVKNRLIDTIQTSIGKGDIAIQKYKNKIAKVKDNLIKLKVNIKVYERKIEDKKASLANLKTSNSSKEKQEIIQNTITDMDNFLLQMKATEKKLTIGLTKMIDSLDLIKMKISALETKRDMLDALKSIQDYSTIEDDVGGINSSIDVTVNDIQKDIYAIEAEMEIDKMFR